MFEGLDPKLPEFMKKKRPAAALQPNAVAVESLVVSNSQPCKSSQEAESSTSPPEPQPGTSTGGITPSGPQVSGSTGEHVSTQCAGEESDSSDPESSSSSSDSDEEWTPGNHAVVPQSAKKTNNPSGKNMC